MQRGHHAAGGIVALDAGAYGLGNLTDTAVGSHLPGCELVGYGAHCMLRFRSKSGLTGLPRSVPAASRQALSRPSPRVWLTPGATLTAHLSMPASGIAGVGTFPGWLVLAVA